MASLMNGLSAAGAGISAFGASAGLESMKADAAQALQASGGVIQGNLNAQKSAAEAELARQADAMATVRESGGRVQAGQIAATAASTAAGVSAEAARLADVRVAARESTARQEAATIANQALTPEMKLLLALGVPLAGATPATPSAASAGTPANTSPDAISSSAAPSPSAGNGVDPDLKNTLIAKTLGTGVPGSDQAIRSAIARDVSNDPAFKYKTAGQQAAEIENRLAVAKGTLGSPEARDSIAAGIASYQLSPLDNRARQMGGGPETMEKVMALNPTYQEGRYPEVNKAMIAFGTGKQGDTVRFLNVGVQHLDTIDQAAQALQNGNVQVLNSLGNAFQQQFGVSAPTTFDGLKQIVATEVEKSISGGIGASADRDRLLKSLDRANSPQQLQAMTDGFRTLMAGQLVGLKQQYEDATDFKSGPFSFDTKLAPVTIKALTAKPSASRPTPPESTQTFGSAAGNIAAGAVAGGPIGAGLAAGREATQAVRSMFPASPALPPGFRIVP